MKRVHNTHLHGRLTARRRYAEGGDIPEPSNAQWRESLSDPVGSRSGDEAATSVEPGTEDKYGNTEFDIFGAGKSRKVSKPEREPPPSRGKPEEDEEEGAIPSKHGGRIKRNRHG